MRALTGRRVRARLLRAGRRRLLRWTTLLELDTPGAPTRSTVLATYDELTATVTWPRNAALQVHLARQLLPGAATYRALRDQGRPHAEAVQLVGRLLDDAVLPHRRRLERLGRLPGFFRAFAVSVRVVTPLLFPRAGWGVRWREVSRERVAFDIDRCFYLATLTELGMPELTTAYCRGDDVLYGGVSPQMAWRRKGTLATGAGCCDFRYERIRGPVTR